MIRVNLLPHREEKRKRRQQQFLGIAVFSVILGLVAGGWADRKFNTSPLFLFLLTLLAFIVGMVRMVRALNEPGPPDDPSGA